MPLDARAIAVPDTASPSQPTPVSVAPVKIDVSRMNFYYGANRVLDQINVKVMPNQVTALIGPSGCGKSTFLRSLNRMNDIIPGTRVEGSVLIDGQDIYLGPFGTQVSHTEYDRIMLRLHDTGKLDAAYQARAPRADVTFPAGATWLCFTDQVLHAALAGHCALEQTFHLPITAMAHPDRSPLRTLERLAGRALA